MKFFFYQACSLSVNTLTLLKLITSEADGFHSKGSPVFTFSCHGRAEKCNVAHTCTHNAFIDSLTHAHALHMSFIHSLNFLNYVVNVCV